MRLSYVCGCCDTAVGEINLPGRPPGCAGAGLTGMARRDIIILSIPCGDCRETLYGGNEKTFYGRSVID
ncbi:MAG: hypothetical protein A4E55_00593 [Pelotomaculum sp. PtaU1.Bin035]|nr:MAG: hypothetical protein A4E55_00593 [Pelotomaculum sp. PtaU1.Bin035]